MKAKMEAANFCHKMTQCQSPHGYPVWTSCIRTHAFSEIIQNN